MKKEQLEKLLRSYELGQTSSEEEAELCNQLGDLKPGKESWFNFLKTNKIASPESLEQDIWNAIQSKEKKKKRILFRAIAAAASVALFISLFLITNTIPKEMSYEDKVAVLEEALAMTSSTPDIIMREVLYEDDIIIIYTETKSNNK